MGAAIEGIAPAGRVLGDVRRDGQLAQVGEEFGRLVGLVGTASDPVSAAKSLDHAERLPRLRRTGGEPASPYAAHAAGGRSARLSTRLWTWL